MANKLTAGKDAIIVVDAQGNDKQVFTPAMLQRNIDNWTKQKEDNAKRCDEQIKGSYDLLDEYNSLVKASS